MEAFKLKPVDAGMVKYGRTETKRAITNVLDTVVPNYKYSSLSELNAALKQYNILADRGSEESRIFKSGGLVYRILDEKGKPIGVPIKASDFYNKPTLKFLEERYSSNDTLRQPFKARIKNEIDGLFINKRPTLNELTIHLQRKGIHVALRQNDAGFIYGITYVDHQTKCIFNGSALGKQYSAKALQERCLQPEPPQQNLPLQPAARKAIGLQPDAIATAQTKANETAFQTDSKGGETMLDALMHPEQTGDYIPGQLKKKGRKKKKGRNISNNR